MTDTTISDGTNSITLFVKKSPKTKPNIKASEIPIPGKAAPFVQFFERGNRGYELQGVAYKDTAAGSTKDSTRVIGLLQYWQRTGTGLATGTLTFTWDEGSDTVFIPEGGLTWSYEPGQTNTGKVIYTLKLIEA